MGEAMGEADGGRSIILSSSPSQHPTVQTPESRVQTRTHVSGDSQDGYVLWIFFLILYYRHDGLVLDDRSWIWEPNSRSRSHEPPFPLPLPFPFPFPFPFRPTERRIHVFVFRLLVVGLRAAERKEEPPERTEAKASAERRLHLLHPSPHPCVNLQRESVCVHSQERGWCGW